MNFHFSTEIVHHGMLRREFEHDFGGHVAGLSNFLPQVSFSEVSNDFLFVSIPLGSGIFGSREGESDGKVVD